MIGSYSVACFCWWWGVSAVGGLIVTAGFPGVAGDRRSFCCYYVWFGVGVVVRVDFRSGSAMLGAVARIEYRILILGLFTERGRFR
jgi:hypothetical protein